jgi:hypothetical protein
MAFMIKTDDSPDTLVQFNTELLPKTNYKKITTKAVAKLRETNPGFLYVHKIDVNIEVLFSVLSYYIDNNNRFLVDIQNFHDIYKLSNIFQCGDLKDLLRDYFHVDCFIGDALQSTCTSMNIYALFKRKYDYRIAPNKKYEYSSQFLKELFGTVSLIVTFNNAPYLYHEYKANMDKLKNFQVSPTVIQQALTVILDLPKAAELNIGFMACAKDSNIVGLLDKSYSRTFTNDDFRRICALFNL